MHLYWRFLCGWGFIHWNFSCCLGDFVFCTNLVWIIYAIFLFPKSQKFNLSSCCALCNSVLHFREGSLTSRVSLAVLSLSMAFFCNPLCNIFFPSSLKLSLMQRSLSFFGYLFRFQESNTFFFWLFCRDFSGNNLACDCNVYSSFVSVISALSSSRAAQCFSPPRVASVRFFPGGSYENHPVQDFTCCMYKVYRDCMTDIIRVISHDWSHIWPVEASIDSAPLQNHATLFFFLVKRVWDHLHPTGSLWTTLLLKNGHTVRIWSPCNALSRSVSHYDLSGDQISSKEEKGTLSSSFY